MSKDTRFLAEDAIDYSDLEPLTRHLLRTMWSRADRKTGIIPRPISLDELARRTGMARRSVQNHITKAVDGGWLLKWAPETRNAIARHEKSKYQLLIPGQRHEVPHRGAGDASEQRHDVPTVINIHRDDPSAGATGVAQKGEPWCDTHEKGLTRGYLCPWKKGDPDCNWVCLTCDRQCIPSEVQLHFTTTGAPCYHCVDCDVPVRECDRG